MRRHPCAWIPHIQASVPLPTSRSPNRCPLGNPSRLLKVAHRVGHGPVDSHLEREVGPKAVAGTAGVADDRSLTHRLASGDRERALVCVARGEAAAVIDAGVVAVATA